MWTAEQKEEFRASMVAVSAAADARRLAKSRARSRSTCTAETIFDGQREQIEDVESTYALPAFRLGSEKQRIFGRGIRSRMIAGMIRDLDPALTTYARAVLDSTWWIALSTKTDQEAWIMSKLYSVAAA